MEEIKHLSKVVSQHYAFAKQEKEKYFGNGAWLPFYSQIVLKKELVKEYDGITIKSTPFNRDWTSCTEYYPFQKNEKYRLFKYTYLDFDKDEEGEYLPSSNVMTEKIAYGLANENGFIIASCAENGLKNKYFLMNNFANLKPDDYKRINIHYDSDCRGRRYFSSYAKDDDIFMECLNKTYNSYRNNAEKMLLSKKSNLAVKVWYFNPLESKKEDVLFDMLQTEHCRIKNELDCKTLKLCGPAVIRVEIDDNYYDELTYGQGNIELKKEELKKFPRYASKFTVGDRKLTPDDFINDYSDDKTFYFKDKLQYDVNIDKAFMRDGDTVKCLLTVPAMVISKTEYDLNGDVKEKEFYDFKGRKLGELTNEKDKIQENCLGNEK